MSGRPAVSRLLFPALRWAGEGGFEDQADAIAAGLARGVGGFILFGGEAEAVRALTADLQARSDRPLLIASDVERGAGQQFTGATRLPPLAALGRLDDLDVTRRAGELTAREARALGVNWAYAPVADVDLEPANPIVGTRAFGTDPAHVARHVAVWVEGCRAGGALSCAKHFPGHGRTVGDSHAELPSVEHGRGALERDLAPFRAAIAAGADSMMTAHVAYPALDPSGAPATLSAAIVTELLRGELGYDGLVVTDALTMEGVLRGGAGEAEAAVRAVGAGCDALLYPVDVEAVAAALEAAAGSRIPAERLAEAVERVEAAAARVAGAAGQRWGAAEDLAWARGIAERTLLDLRGEPRLAERSVDVLTVDDDLGGPYPPPSRAPFLDALRETGLEVREVERAEPGRPLVVPVYSDIRAWKGRPGLSAASAAAVREAVTTCPEAVVALFAHPRLAGEVDGRHVLGAWGGEALMQEAAARRLAGAA